MRLSNDVPSHTTGRGFRAGDDSVDAEEFANLVREAAVRRKGWKVILAHCDPRSTLADHVRNTVIE